MLQEASKKHNQWICIANRYCNNSIDAEDIVQDMYIKLHSINKEINDSYILMIIRNLAYDLTRKKSKTVRIDDYKKTYNKLTTEINIETECNNDILKGLSDNQKKIVNLRCDLKYNYEDIASRLGMKEGTVRVELHRARKQVLKNYNK